MENGPVTPEGRIKKIVTAGLKAIQVRYPGKLWYRMPVSRGMGLPWLDYHGCVVGLTFAIETKRDFEHDLTAQQKHTQYELICAGALVFIVYDTATAEAALQSIEHVIGMKCRHQS
jgi:hypothetical protein